MKDMRVGKCVVILMTSVLAHSVVGHDDKDQFLLFETKNCSGEPLDRVDGLDAAEQLLIDGEAKSIKTPSGSCLIQARHVKAGKQHDVRSNDPRGADTS